MASLKEYKQQVTPYSWNQPGKSDLPSSDFAGIWTNPSPTTSAGKRPARSRTVGGGGRAARTTTTTRTPTRPAPKAPNIPAFAPPEYDEAEVKKLTQKLASPSLRRLRGVLQREMGRSYENPNVRRMTLREALEGYGLGVEGALGGAESRARGEYGARYSKEYAASAMTYQAQTQAAMQSYQNAFAAYMNSMKQETVTGPSGGTASGGWSKEDFGPAAWAKFGKDMPMEVKNPAFAQLQANIGTGGI